MKKWIKAYMCCFMLAVAVFTGCVLQQKNSSQVKINNLRGSLVLVCDKKYENDIKVLGESFKALHNGVNIEIKVATDFRPYLNGKLEAKAPVGDVILYDEQYISNLIEKHPNSFLDLGDAVNYAKDTVPKNKIENSLKNQKNYGMPISSNPRFLIYRTEELLKSNTSVSDIKTWDDFTAVGKNISKVTGEVPLINIGGRDDLFLILLTQLKTVYLDKDNKPAFTSIASTRAYEKLVQLYNEKTVDNVSSVDELVALIKKGKVFSAIVDYKSAKYVEEQYPEGKGKWSVYKLPAFEPGGNNYVSIGGTQLMISKDCKNVKVAREFVSFAVTKEVQLELANKSDLFPANTQVYSCVDFDKKDEYFSNNRVCYLGSTIEKNTYPLVFSKYFEMIKSGTRVNIDNLKGKDSKTVLDIINNECSKLILDVSKGNSQ